MNNQIPPSNKMDFDTLAMTVRDRITGEGSLLSYAVKISHDSNLAEDLCQATMLIASRKFDKFDPKRGSFKSWTYSILLNQYRDYLRSAKRREINETSLASSVGTGEEIAAIDPAIVDVEAEAISNASLDAMLGRLKGVDRRIAAKLSEGVKEEEIMAELALSPAAFEQRITAIRHKLHDFRPYSFVASYGDKSFALVV